MIRIFTLFVSCFLLSYLYGQEICDNGIDDDGDGLIDLNDSLDCNCDPIGYANYIPNPSFEDTVCVPFTFSGFECAAEWTESTGTTEFYHVSGYGYPAGWWYLPFEKDFARPAPHGSGVASFIISDGGVYEHIGVCLINPLIAGVTYTFEFTTQTSQNLLNADIEIYGSAACPAVFSQPRFDCLDYASDPNWDLLGTAFVTLASTRTWETYSITITPVRDIYSIALGGACNPSNVGNNANSFIFHFDDLKLTLLDTIAAQVTSLVSSGSFCNNNKVLTAATDSSGGTWQWYKDGIALVGHATSSIDLSINSFGPGNYTTRYTFNGNCDTSKIDVLRIPTDTAEFSYMDTSYCLSGSDPVPTLTGTLGGEFTITPPGVINSISGLIDLTNSGLGVYTVTYRTNDPICPDTTTFKIEIISCTPPTADYNVGDTSICIGECVDFTDLSIGTTSWQWSFNGGIPNLSNTQGSHNICFNTVGVYDIELIAGNRFGSDTVKSSLEVIARTDASFNYSSGIICDSIPNALPLISGTPGGTFTINSGAIIDSTNGEIDVTSSSLGLYVVTYITNGFCPDTAIFNIEIANCTPPTALYSVSDSAICGGECIDFTDLSSGATDWDWTFDGGIPLTANTQGPHNVCFNSRGTYNIELVVTNKFGLDTKTSTVEVSANPMIDAGNDLTIQLGESTTLEASGSNGSYSWAPPEWLACPTCITSLSTPKETVTYTVTVVDSNGCVARDDMTILVDYDIVIFVPNIFSPNGDGNNDMLYVRGSGVESLLFVVYDRWGEKVFETKSLGIGWDGNFRGKPMNSSVFKYYLQATFEDGTSTEQKADITLVR